MRWWKSKEGLGCSITGRDHHKTRLLEWFLWRHCMHPFGEGSLETPWKRKAQSLMELIIPTFCLPCSKRTAHVFRTCYSSNLPDESCVIICTISWFGKAFTGTKAFLTWKFFNSEAYYYYYCFFLLSFHPSLPEEHWIGNHVPKWQEHTMY